MKLTKKLIQICLASILLCSNVSAMKSSISLPENMDRYAFSEQKDSKDSPYELKRTCDRIVMDSDRVPIDQTICDTAHACNLAYDRMLNFLHNKEVPSDCFYIAGLSNYEEIMGYLNYILFEIILAKSDNTKLFFTPSDETRRQLCMAMFKVESVMKKYESLFYIELFRTFAKPNKTRQLYELMNTTWDGIWKISELNSFREMD